MLLSIFINILSLGAVSSDTTVNNAPMINRAIEECSAQGGGIVSVPQGVFTTGSIFLKSGVTLRIEQGAKLRGTKNLADYTHLTTTADLSKYESGQGSVNYNSATDPIWSQALIFGIGIKNAGIEGPGCIDGNNVRNPLGEEHQRGPHTVLLADCKNIKIHDVKVENASNYAFLGYKIEQSEFYDIHVEGGWDGIHLRGTRKVKIKDCTLSTGDDAIAGGYWEKTVIEGCRLNSSCNGIRMIMPSVGVTVSNCDFIGPGRFEHITSHRTNSEAAITIEPGAWGKAPGRLDKICIKDCRVRETLTPLSVTLGEDNTLGTITIERLVARDITRHALSVKSWGTAVSDKVVMRDCDLQFRGIDDPQLPDWFKTHSTNEWPVFPSWGLYFRNVGKVKMQGVSISVKGKDYRTAVIYDNVKSKSGEPVIVDKAQSVNF